MAEPTIAENKLDVEAAPSWFRTAAAAFRYNNLVGAALSSETLYESLFPSDTTPVSDEDILKAVADNGFESDIGSFAHIKTRGDLTAMTEQVRKERQDRQTLELASTWSSLSANMLAGALDLPSLITGPAAAEMMAARGFGRLAQSAAGAAATGFTQTVAQEIGLQALQETRGTLESVEGIAGATILGAILGPTITKAFGRTTVKKVGDGVRDDIVEMASGRVEAATEKSVDDIVADVHIAAKAADDADVSAPVLAARQDASAHLEAVGRDITPSELALIRKIAKDAGVEAHEIVESLPKAAQADLHHAAGLGAEPAVRALSQIGGGNPVMDLSVSPSPAAREAVFNFANIKTMVDGRESPAQVMSIAARVFGQQGIAKTSILDAHTEWYRDVARGLRLRPRQFDTEYGLDRFGELVTHAVAFGKEPHLHPDPAMARAIQHPAIQKAAAAYRKFDDFIGSESVRSGLLREGHKVPDHLRHVYAAERILSDRERFIASEKLNAEQRVLADQMAEAEATFAARKAELDEFVERNLQDAIDDVKSKLAATEQEGIEDVIRESMVKRMRIAERQNHGLRLGRELQRIEAKVRREKQAERNKLVKTINSRAFKKLDPAEQEPILNQFHSLEARWATKTDELEAAAGRKFDAEAMEAAREVEAKTDKWVEKEMERLRRSVERLGERLESKAVKEIERYYRRELAKVRAAQIKATNGEARLEIREWAGQHAQGVFDAIVYGETGAGSSHGRLTGGSIRGGNKARNVYTPTRDLIVEGWINPDLFLVMDKMARQDGIDAVIARKFRRNPTDAEKRLAARNSPDAYWLDGQDNISVPDVDMRGVKSRVQDDFDELVAAAAGDPKKLLSLARQRIADQQSIDDMVSIARGTHATDTATSSLRNITGAVKAAQFLWYMGKNSVTNVGDLFKLTMVHGLKEPLAYAGLRLRERFESSFADNVFGREHGRVELREHAAAAAIGLERVNMSRLVYSTDLSDPYASAIRSKPGERMAALMTQMGSKVFLINHLNDAMKTTAFGIAQHRLAKMALSGKSTSEMSLSDRNWLQYIGANDKLLGELSDELASQGRAYTPGRPIRWSIETMHPDLQDRIVAALHKDNSTTVLSPDALSKLNFLRTPVLDLMTQFSTFAIESGMGTMNVLGQRLRAGEIVAPTAGIMAMLLGAFMTQTLSIYSDGNPQTIERYWRAFETNPGFAWYNIVDRSGLLGPIGYVSNMADDMFDVGLRSLARAAAGDDLKDQYPFSKQKFGQHNGDAWKTLGGPIGRTFADFGQIFGDVAGSIAGQKHGVVPLLHTNRQITQKTIDKGMKYVPLVNVFYLKAVMENYVTPSIREPFPKR